MKQNTFDGIKINVPHDAKFIQIPDGFKENTYGITIHTFKDNQSMVNFLNSLQNAKNRVFTGSTTTICCIYSR